MAFGTDGGFRSSGLVVAAIGFAISRATVVSSVTNMDSLGVFLLTGAGPMVAAFGLVVFGIALAVSSLSRTYVRTVARWSVIGTASMLAVVLIAAVDAGGMTGVAYDPAAGGFATKAVLGGSVGGTLTGIYAARAKRRTREAAGQADRLHLLNRLLRDEVLNATTVVLGHADILTGREETREHAEPIQRNAEHIQGVIDDVGSLTADGNGDRAFAPFTVGEVIESEAAALRDSHPDATITVSGDLDTAVRADDQLGLLFEQLLSNAVEHDPDPEPTVAVTVTRTATAAEVRIEDDGPGLDAEERALLESGSLDRYDRPSEGFGLWIARILLDRYDGSARVDVDGGTAITVSLPRPETTTERTPHSFGVTPRQLGIAAVAGLIAGVGMGLALQSLSATIPVIGALYGGPSVVVGWITHLFHSVVFATVFAALLSHPRTRGFRRTALAAVGFALALWFGAAGLLMPLWLRAVGVAAALPQWQPASLVGHLLWAVLLAGSYYGLVALDGHPTDA
jgi:signal transduction histidine kinase